MLGVDHEQHSQASELVKKPKSFTNIPMVSAEGAYNNYMAAIQEPLPEQQKMFDVFFEALQLEAQGLGEFKDLWLNYQLIIAYINSGQWEFALQAIDDALLLAANLGKGESIFSKLLDQVLANIGNSGE
jgi:hypothetical protein